MATGLQQLRQRSSWEEICDDFSQIAAIEFARKCCQFAADFSIPDPAPFYRKATKRYVDKFLTEFELELKRFVKSGFSNVQAQNAPTSQQNHDNTVTYREKSQTDSIPNGGRSPKQNRMSRKLSMRLKNIFKKQENKENVEPMEDPVVPGVGLLVDVSSSEKETGSSTGCEKTGSGHDIIKEGLVHELINIERNGDVELTWQKCKLLLSKAPGGYMLEFYLPPRVRMCLKQSNNAE